MMEDPIKLNGLAPDIFAHQRHGWTEEQYREACEALADQMSVGEDAVLPPHQREADIENAEWMLAIFFAAGFAVTRAAP